MINTIKRVVTHSTVFHADDVFGVAMWKLINPKIEVIRTLEPEQYDREDTIIFDIGLGKYDHHQEEKVLRSDDVPYCGFGLLWRDFGRELCPEFDAWARVDETLVYPIDKHDNGVAKNILATAIGNMNPTWDSNVDSDTAFFQAVEVARVILKAAIDQANATVNAKDLVLGFYDGGVILVMDQFLPWMNVVQNDPRLKDVLFVVYPSQRGGWNVQTVTKTAGSYTNRMDFPKEWLGHADPDRGIHFAHTANFLIACDTKEQAIKVAQEAVEEGNNPYAVAYSI